MIVAIFRRGGFGKGQIEDVGKDTCSFIDASFQYFPRYSIWACSLSRIDGSEQQSHLMFLY